MRNLIHLLVLTVSIGLMSCEKHELSITIANPSDIERQNEVVIAELDDLNLSSKQLILVDKATMEEVRAQVIDRNNDGIADAIAFQVSLGKKQNKQFIIREEASALTSSEVKTFARFVPERTDDFTWENDKVAFRTYGPEAQRLIEENMPGGTLSSGIDCWLKKVDYSIINKWYKENDSDPGYYHIDHGEGLDNYHVGPSRGCGGTGVLKDGQFYTSKNYVDHKVLENGPVHTSFELDYERYPVGEQLVKERKVISIDLGNNFTKYEIYVEGTDVLTTGLTLHDLEGTINSNEKGGWINYHTPHVDEELSTAIVAHPDYYMSVSEIKSDVKDESHALMNLKVKDGKVVFYSGFYWSGSEQFNNNKSWEKYLDYFAITIKEPLTVKVN